MVSLPSAELVCFSKAVFTLYQHGSKLHVVPYAQSPSTLGKDRICIKQTSKMLLHSLFQSRHPKAKISA